MSSGMFDSMNVSASALTAENLRMDVIAGNIANADTPQVPGQTPFRRQLVELQTQAQPGDPVGQGVAVSGIISDPAPPRQEYDPTNPAANAQGYVTYPNVDVVQEQVDLEAASRAYEANVTVMDTGKQMAQTSLDLLS